MSSQPVPYTPIFPYPLAARFRRAPIQSSPLIAIPIRSFESAKQRLAPVVGRRIRAKLATAMAKRTLDAARQVSHSVAVITADVEVSKWAADARVTVIPDHTIGLDGASATAVRVAVDSGVPWLVLHADLPAITAKDLAYLTEQLPEGGYVLAPSYDGGTPVLGGYGEMRFAYGPGSFRTHLAAVGGSPHQIVAGSRLSLDLDTPADLAFFMRWPPTSWIKEIVSTT